MSFELCLPAFHFFLWRTIFKPSRSLLWKHLTVKVWLVLVECWILTDVIIAWQDTSHYLTSQTWTTLGATPAAAVATNPSVMVEVRLAVRALSSSPGSARALLGTTTQLSCKYRSQISPSGGTNQAGPLSVVQIRILDLEWTSLSEVTWNSHNGKTKSSQDKDFHSNKSPVCELTWLT